MVLKDYSTIWQLKWDRFKDDAETQSNSPDEEPVSAEMGIILKIMAEINKTLGEETFKEIELLTDTLFPPETTEEIRNLFSIKYFKKFQKGSIKTDKFGIDYETISNRVMVFFHRPNCIFVLTTGSVAKELKDNCDSEFPYKIASSLVDLEKIQKNERIKFVGKIRKRIEEIRDQGPIDMRDISGLLTILTAQLKKNASIYKFDFLRGIPKNTSTSNTSRNINASTSEIASIATPIPLNLSISKKNIKLKKTLSVDQDVQLLDHYAKIVNGEPTYKFESASGISEEIEEIEDFRKGVEMVDVDTQDKLDNKLYQELYEKIKEPEYPFNFEVYHELEDKIFASDYKILYMRKYQKEEWNYCPSASELLSFLKRFFPFSAAIDFNGQIKKKMDMMKLSYFYKNKRHSDKIINFIECVIVYEDKTFWRLNQQWLQVSNDCIVDMHIKFLELLNEGDFLIPIGHSDHLTEKWKHVTKKNEKSGKIRNISEEAFNKLFHDEKYPDFIVGDKSLTKNIELFDILRLGNATNDGTTTTNIYHVKFGFAQKARDTCSQLRHSAKLIYSAIAQNSKGNTILADFYKKVCKDERVVQKFQALNIHDENDFVQKFDKQNKLTFVYGGLKNVKASLRDEKDVKYKISKKDIKEYLSLIVNGLNDGARKKKLLSIFGDNYDLNHLADKIYLELTRVKGYFTDKGVITARLLYDPVDLKSDAHDTFLKDLIAPYRSKFKSLIGKIDIVETKNILHEYGFIFKIDEIEKEEGEFSQIQIPEDMTPPTTPITPIQGTSRSSVNKRKKNASTNKKFKKIPAVSDSSQTKMTSYFQKSPRPVKELDLSTSENVKQEQATKIPKLSMSPEPVVVQSSNCTVQNSSEQVDVQTQMSSDHSENRTDSETETEPIDELLNTP